MLLFNSHYHLAITKATLVYCRQFTKVLNVVDENGVSSAELENAKELRRFTDFLGEQIDGIFGAGTAKLITGGRCIPTEFIRFMCETAHYFTQTSSELIKHYTDTIGDGVMK